MLLSIDLAGVHSETMLPTAAAYCRLLAPVPAPVRGTTVPSAVIESTTVEGKTNVHGTNAHGTDMRAVAFVERAWDGSAIGLAEWFQPSVGLNKRHGATRGKPPREHLRGS